MAKLRQTEPIRETVGGYDFYICPFPAFRAANLTGELAAILMPVLAALVPLVEKGGKNKDDGLMDIDVSEAAPEIGKAFEGISGDKLEVLLRKLLVVNRNIIVELENDQTGEKEQEYLTEDIANELFCGELQNMFILAFHVIKYNFNGFFKKAGTLSGKAGAVEKLRKIF